jgi:AcrR family transcriptional regulator
MGRDRLHSEDALLDAARSVVLSGGVRAATMANLSAASGAPTGSLYHAFGSRQGVLAALWLRATERSQRLWIEAEASQPDDPVDAGVAMALSVLAFARREPDDVRVLMALRPEDFPEIVVDLDAYNKPIHAGLRRLATRLDGPDAGLRAHLATVELPYGSLRVRLGPAGLRISSKLDTYLAAAARAVLADPTGARR